MTNPEVKPEDIASFKAPGVGAAAMPESFRELYRQRFGRELGHGYGLTEAPTGVTSTDPNGPIIPGSSGRAAAHLQVCIQDAEGRKLAPGESGEVCVAAATEGDFAGLYTPMLGYWRRADATAEALRGGWLHTGDIGRMDEAGNLFIEGRRNDVVLRGGSNVYPAEIERVLQLDERVADCAVVGKPDVRLGERVVAFVQLAAGAAQGEALQEDLLALCRSNLARYKVPEEWVFVADMPRNAMNKIVKKQLKDKYFAEA
jgi:long-chain acyl-CoA synthetase